MGGWGGACAPRLCCLGLRGLVELGAHCHGTHSLLWGNTTGQACSLLCCLPCTVPELLGMHPESDSFQLCHVPISSLTRGPGLWSGTGLSNPSPGGLGQSQAHSPPHHPGLCIASPVFLRQLSLFNARDKSLFCVPWIALCSTTPPHRPSPLPAGLHTGLDVLPTAGTEDAQPWCAPGPTSLAHFISVGQD